MSKDRTYNLYVASKNRIKIDASVNVINKYIEERNGIKPIINVFSFNVPSNVSNQPVNGETILGCENRFNQIKKIIKSNLSNSFIISIENGLFFNDEIPTLNSKIYDACVVIIQNPNGEIFQYESEIKTQIETRFLLSSLETNKNLTAGYFMEKTYGQNYNSQNWHHNVKSYYNNSEVFLSRREIIEETLYKCLLDK